MNPGKDLTPKQWGDKVRAASSYHVDIVFAGVVVFAALSLAMTSLVKMIEKRLSGWRPQHANDGGAR